MRYLPGLPDHEGSVCFPGYNRAGCRTPMQWDDARPNAGFSDAPTRAALYLPHDPAPDRPTVAAQRDDPGSPLHLVRRLIALRREHPGARAPAPRPRCSRAATRSPTSGAARHLVVVNPRRAPAAAPARSAIRAHAQPARGQRRRA